MSIQQQVVLRHRADGYLRFALPATLTVPDVGDRLVAELSAMDGVYRVDLYPRQGKLAIRYLDTVIDFGAVVRRLYALIGELAGRVAAAVRPAPAAAIPVTTTDRGPTLGEWVTVKVEEVRETVAALGIVLQRTVGAVSDKPRWLQDFANDLLMLFLIKLHWHYITTLWLPNPWTYRYEWLATFYLIYLQVQSRLPKRA